LNRTTDAIELNANLLDVGVVDTLASGGATSGGHTADSIGALGKSDRLGLGADQHQGLMDVRA
jgi:hypothetical protein